MQTANIKNRTTMSGWVVYSLEDGSAAFIGHSRNDARDFRNSLENPSDFSGPRKANVTITLSK